MKRLLRARATVKGLLQVMLLGILAALPIPARAQVHGGSIQKECHPSNGAPNAQPGETIDCMLTVTNQDTFGDSLRIDAIIDRVCHRDSCSPAGSTLCPAPGAAQFGTPSASCPTAN